MQSDKDLSVVLGSYNRLELLKLTIASVRHELATIADSEIIVIDGGSDDGTVQWLTSQKDVISIIQHNRGEWNGRSLSRRSWGYFINLGFKCAQGRFICMLSDDSLVVPGSIANGIRLLETRLQMGERIGAVAFYWRNWPVQERFGIQNTFGRYLFVNHGLYLREALASVNYIDEISYDFYHADGDVCLRMLEAGWKTLDCKTSFVEHLAHGYDPTAGSIKIREGNLKEQQRDWDHYVKKWSHLNDAIEPPFQGDWQYIDYKDENNTSSEFEDYIKRSREAEKASEPSGQRASRLISSVENWWRRRQ